MAKNNLKKLLTILGLVLQLVAVAQPNDCRRAIVICDDKSFSFTPKFGSGIDDFKNPKNDPGCLERRENFSVWFYFEFRKDMPLNSGISFVLEDTASFTCIGQDYDFALYGNDVTCDSLGSPIRCSFAQISQNNRIIRTGLGGGAKDTTENLEGDGFVDSLIVQPGQGFFLLIDFFVGICENFDSTAVQSFRFSWGGSAAPYLNCIANPNCDQVQLSAGKDTTVCAGTDMELRAVYSNTSGQERITWVGLDEAASFLNKQDTAITQFKIPSDAFGNYVFVVTVEEGNCLHRDTVVLTVRPAPAPIILGNRIVCPNQESTLFGGGGFASYRWSTGAQTQDANVSGPGIYALTVTNGFGCAGEDTIVLVSKNLPIPQISGDTILCPGESTLLSTDAGYPLYRWSNGSTLESIRVDSGGVYGVTLTDADGCFVTTSIVVRKVEPAPPTILGNAYFCAGGTTLLYAPPGYASLRWSNGSMADSIQLSAPGLVQLTVTDTFGCTAASEVTVLEKNNPLPQIVGKLGFCVGDSTVLRVESTYSTYQWSTGAETAFIGVYTPGLYSVTVTDAFGCRGSVQVNADTFSLPTPKISGDFEFCEGSFQRITAGNYVEFEWSTGDVLPDILVFQNGLYSVIVTDKNGCKGGDVVEVVVHPNPVPFIEGPFKLCPDSSVQLRVTESFSRFEWSNGDTLPSIRVEEPGMFEVTVTSAAGCSGKALFNLEEAPRLPLTIIGEPNICEGSAAIWEASPGFNTYQWSFGSKSDKVSLVNAGLYGLTVSDAFGCLSILQKNLEVFSNPPVAISGQSPFCLGQLIALATPSGYASYNWSTGERTSSIQIDTGGLYSVTLTTAEGCTRSDTMLVVSNAPVLPVVRPGQYFLCAADTLRFEAGLGFLTYKWSDGSTLPFLDVNRSGNYGLMVVDSNRCETSVLFSVEDVLLAAPEIYGPPSFCEGQSAQFITGGGNYKSLEWSTGETTASISIQRGGTYKVTVTDVHGCTASSQKAIEEKISPKIDITGDLSICRGDTTVLSVPGGYANYTWTTGSTDTSIVVFKPGPYGILVLGANGCAVSDEVQVIQSRIPYPVIEGDRFFCSNDSVALEVEGGFPGYKWSTGEVVNSIFINQDGIYGVTVYDELGCLGFAQVRVISQPAPEPVIVGDFEFCKGDSALLRVEDGFSLVRWNPGEIYSNPLIVRDSGAFIVEVTAMNGCKARDTARVSFLPAPFPEITGDTFFCEGGSATLSVVDTFEGIRWGDGQIEQRVVVSMPQTVVLEAVNTFGCVGLDSVKVVEILLPVADPGPDTSLTCIRQDVKLGAEQSPSPTFSVQWEGPGITASNRNDARPIIDKPGTYKVVWTNIQYSCISEPAEVLVRDLAFVPEVLIYAEDTLDCITDSIFLNGNRSTTGTGFTYTWFKTGNPDTLNRTLRISVNTAGTYLLEVADPLTGCENRQQMVIEYDTIRPVPKIMGSGVLNCLQDSVLLEVSAQPDWVQSWVYNGVNIVLPDSVLQYAARAPGIYMVHAVNRLNGCVGGDSIEIIQDIEQPKPDAGSDTELDCNAQEALLTAQMPLSVWKLRWRDAATDFILSRTAILRAEYPGRFVLEAINPSNGCIGTDTVVVSVNENTPREIELTAFAETCAGSMDGKVQALSVLGGDPPYVFRLAGNEVFSSTTSFENLSAGTYRLIVQDASGCETSQTFSIEKGLDAFLDLGPDQYIKLGDLARITAQTNISGQAMAEFRWIQPDTLTQKQSPELTVRPLASTQFTAIIRDTNGCSASDALWIYVEASQRLFIPNAFSPNGDGQNDVFMLFSGPEVVRINSLKLFNRWGEMVFEQNDFQPNDPTVAWDGTFRGKIQNPGVYVYYGEVEYLDGRIESFKGDVTLIR